MSFSTILSTPAHVSYLFYICGVTCPVGIFNANEFVCQTFHDVVDNNTKFYGGEDRIIRKRNFFIFLVATTTANNIEMSNVENNKKKINCKKKFLCEFLYIDTICCYGCELTFICEKF